MSTGLEKVFAGITEGFEYGVRGYFLTQIFNLKGIIKSKLYMWYLHGPDRTTPFEETLKGINDLYKEGLVK